MIGRVSLQSTPADRFVEQIEAIRRQLDALPNDAVRALTDELERVRRQVLGEIAASTADSFRRGRMRDAEPHATTERGS